MPNVENARRQAPSLFVTVPFVVLVALSVVGGFALARWLAGLHSIPTTKILNVVGIAYGLIGVLVLSEAIVRTEAIRQFMVTWVGSALLWTHTGVALGAIVGAVSASLMARPSASAAYSFAFSLWAYVMLIGGAVDGTVTNPLTPRLRNMPARHQRLGLIILVTGLVLQLVAAIRDF